MRRQMHTRSRERLVDRLVEAYVDWRETCGWVNDAYRCWTSETVPSGRVAFDLYMAALDAEQQAAEVYAGLVLRAGEVLCTEDLPADLHGDSGWGVGWR